MAEINRKMNVDRCQSGGCERLLVVTGPTASGKTRRAVDIARALDGEIVSADSRQVYKRMDIGTGKDLAEYGEIPFHMIDVREAGDKYNLYQYLRDANAVIDDISCRGRLPVLCGGSGMYVEAVLNGLALPEVPENKPLRERLAGKSLEELTEMLRMMKTLHNVTDVDTVKRAVRAIEIQTYYNEHPEECGACVPRPRTNSLIVGVDIDRENRRRRISQRLRSRLAEGMVDEVRSLINSGIPADDLIYYGLEYKYLTLHVTGQLGYDEMVSQLETAIHQFAKRQMTWFRGMSRRGFKIEWLPWDMPADEFVERVKELLAVNQMIS